MIHKKGILILFAVLGIYTTGNGQIVSYFSWDTNPPTAADIGPNATSISGSALSGSGGEGGSNGLNAGTPKADLNMVVPGSPTFDLDGIDVSFDYQREESVGTFIKRGASLSIQGCSNLSVTFRIEDGAGSCDTISSGNVYAIPDDDVYRRYRFYYLPTTGEASLMVDGVSVWSYDGVDNRNLYWTGTGDVVIGIDMDGTGNNKTFLDNMTIGNVSESALPIELVDFNAANYASAFVRCQWTTLSERENDYFTVERSADGMLWEEIGTVDGAGNSAIPLTYEFIDSLPLIGFSYYRLKQTDFNGEFTTFTPVSVQRESGDFTLFPNPATEVVNVLFSDQKKQHVLTILNAQGQLVWKQKAISGNSDTAVEINTSLFSRGVYFVTYGSQVKKLILN